MRSIAFLVFLVACGNPGRREVQPLAPMPGEIPGASDKQILAPSPALAPPDAPTTGASTGGSINITVERDGGTPIDGAALPNLPDAMMPDAGSPMRQ